LLLELELLPLLLRLREEELRFLVVAIVLLLTGWV
jgi:hypothetical protein